MLYTFSITLITYEDSLLFPYESYALIVALYLPTLLVFRYTNDNDVYEKIIRRPLRERNTWN